ncbi:MAG: NTP transferase domain-containing protein [Elusimicrobia bacterium]|nr:NTP transferase domain-containing protein [Elusimicrobiota bacterium]
MKALILAGGLGTRLRPLTFSVPKPMLAVGDKPIVEILIEHLRSQNVKDIVLATGYKSDLMKAYFENGKKHGVRIRYVQETEPLGTAGPIRLAAKELGGARFILLNGDILTAINLAKMLKAHLRAKAAMTVALKKWKWRNPFGQVRLRADKSVASILEKPTQTFDISAGIYLCEPAVISHVPARTRLAMPALINALILRRKTVHGYHFEETWQAIDTLQNLEEAAHHRLTLS